MKTRPAAALASAVAGASLALALAAPAAPLPARTPAAASRAPRGTAAARQHVSPSRTPRTSLADPGTERDDYANEAFAKPLGDGLAAFYARDFERAQGLFERALGVTSDDALAISFLDAAAAQRPGALDALVNAEEDAAAAAPRSYADHVRLGFSYLFETNAGRDRTQDARDEFGAAIALEPQTAAAAHVGLGIMRFDERSANRAKTEFLAALRADPDSVLAREYLGQLYQTDLRDPQRGLAYVIDVPNLVPGYADIDFHIGSLLHDLGQPQAAVPYLRRGLALDPNHVGEAGRFGLTLIGRIDIELHDFAAAREALGEAVAADTDAIYATTLLRKIRSGDYGATPAPEPSATSTP